MIISRNKKRKRKRKAPFADGGDHSGMASSLLKKTNRWCCFFQIEKVFSRRKWQDKLIWYSDIINSNKGYLLCTLAVVGTHS